MTEEEIARIAEEKGMTLLERPVWIVTPKSYTSTSCRVCDGHVLTEFKADSTGGWSAGNIVFHETDCRYHKDNLSPCCYVPGESTAVDGYRRCEDCDQLFQSLINNL